MACKARGAGKANSPAVQPRLHWPRRIVLSQMPSALRSSGWKRAPRCVFKTPSAGSNPSLLFSCPLPIPQALPASSCWEACTCYWREFLLGFSWVWSHWGGQKPPEGGQAPWFRLRWRGCPSPGREGAHGSSHRGGPWSLLGKGQAAGGEGEWRCQHPQPAAQTQGTPVPPSVQTENAHGNRRVWPETAMCV